MGDHYATCRPENCGVCGQLKGYCRHTRAKSMANYMGVKRRGSEGSKSKKAVVRKARSDKGTRRSYAPVSIGFPVTRHAVTINVKDMDLASSDIVEVKGFMYKGVVYETTQEAELAAAKARVEEIIDNHVIRGEDFDFEGFINQLIDNEADRNLFISLLQHLAP